MKFVTKSYKNRQNLIKNILRCQHCGYIFNQSFNFNKISKAYESKEYLSRKIVSKVMNSTLTSIKNKILEYAESEYVFLEIAPGSGDLAFSLIKDSKHYYTIDPSEVSKEVKELENLTHIQGFFNYKLLQKHKKYPINFIIFRHLLEHIPNPREFLEEVVAVLENDGKIYIEVPNAIELFSHKRFYEKWGNNFNYKRN